MLLMFIEKVYIQARSPDLKRANRDMRHMITKLE